MAESVFARQQPKPRMRQQRNNSVTPVPDAPSTDVSDESQLSIVPDADEPTLDTVPDHTESAPEQNDTPGEQDTPSPSAQAEPAAAATTPATDGSDDNRSPTPDGPAAPPVEDQDAPTPEVVTEAAEPAPQAAAAPSTAKKPSKTSSSKSRNAKAQPQQGAGTALAVINPDGSVTVDPGTHLIDLRDVATQDDPHALVDMLGELRKVTDSELRQHVTAQISTAITEAALR